MINRMDIINLTIGILLVVIGYLLFTLQKKERKKERKKQDKDDNMLLSFDIEIYFGIIVLIVCGLVLVFKEIKFMFE